MKSTPNFDMASAVSIADYAKVLVNRSLSDVRKLPVDVQNVRNKGMLGSLIEEYYFEYIPGPNKTHQPDFAEAGVELKVTGVLPNSKEGQPPYKAKERLVLTMINYMSIADEDWLESSFLKKCGLMLVLFYLYEKDLAVADLKFVLNPLLWRFPDVDLEIIRKDWLKIQSKVLQGKAHEISEGDTFYLAACRKGSGGPGERLREQPFSSTRAKARALSLKPSYVNTMIASNYMRGSSPETSIIKNANQASIGIEQVVQEKFIGLEGLTVEEIAGKFDYAQGLSKSKSYLASLTMRVLGTRNRTLPEFEKADILVKTVRLSETGTPKEAVSFPNFKFLDLLDMEWEDSSLYASLAEKKFFFVVYQYDKLGSLRFKKVMFWNMSYPDRQIVRGAWLKTVEAVRVSKVDHMPKISDNCIIHVRPKGKNRLDTYPLPDGTFATKRCFWLNQKYIAEVLK